MKTVRLYLDAVAFRGAGVESWGALRTLMDGAAYAPPTAWDVVPACLAARTARRVSPQIRLALAVAEQIAPALDDEAGWVFASSVGEGETLQVILEALREPAMMIQPLRFQNSVHNAAAGQWSIAAGGTGPITSIAAHDETVGAGFLKAGLQVALEARPVGLVFYDVPLPEPLNSKRPLGQPLGAGFALSPRSQPSTVASIEMTVRDGLPTAPRHEACRTLAATGNPVAAVLPLLEIIAGSAGGDVALALHGGGALHLAVSSA